MIRVAAISSATGLMSQPRITGLCQPTDTTSSATAARWAARAARAPDVTAGRTSAAWSTAPAVSAKGRSNGYPSRQNQVFAIA